MKAKKYQEGGKIPPQKKPVYGPPKPPGYKEPSREELKERKDEAAYLKRRKEADRAYESVIKDGGTKEQATKAAEKILSRGSYRNGGVLMEYLKGGQVKLDANKDGKITGADFMMLRKKK
jgi:pimeloyl-CoA synthetase